MWFNIFLIDFWSKESNTWVADLWQTFKSQTQDIQTCDVWEISENISKEKKHLLITSASFVRLA